MPSRPDLGRRYYSAGALAREMAGPPVASSQLWSPGLDRGRGSAAHRRYQEQQADREGFEAEVPVTARFGDVTVRGRADAIHFDPARGFILEELKTGEGPWLRELARCQAEIYAEALQAARGQRFEADIALIDGAGEAIFRETLGAARRATSRERIVAALARLEAERDLREQRVAGWRNRLPTLEPPFASWRPAQREMLREVNEALVGGTQLLIEAPTGSGKTAAVAYPALRSALSGVCRAFFLTPRKPGQHGALSLLERMLGRGTPAAVQRSAARSLCHLRYDACAPETCERANTPVADEPTALLRDASVIRRESLARRIEPTPHCAYWTARALANDLPFVVADVDVLLRGEFVPTDTDEFQPGRVLLLDEVHQLPDRARSHWHRELGIERFDACLASLEFSDGRAVGDLRDATAALRELWLETVDYAPADPTGVTPDAFDPGELEPSLGAFEAACWKLVDDRYNGTLPSPAEPWVVAMREVGALRQACSSGDPGFTPVAYRTADNRSVLGVWCIDPAPRLATLFERADTVIGFTATLPGDPVALLGMDPDRCAILELPEQRDPKLRPIAVDARYGTRFRERSRETTRIAAAISKWVSRAEGHALVLVPSFAWLADIADALALDRPLRVQKPDDSDAERRAHEDAVSHAAAPACLLAAASGALAEGLDYDGGALATVIVVGPPVPPPSPLRDFLRRRFDACGDDGFLRVYAEPAMRAVRQGAGRLWRSPEDTGQLVLLGRRFARPPYASLLPEPWRMGEFIGDD